MAKTSRGMPTLLEQIETAHDISGGAVYPKTMEGKMKKLERAGLIERHHLANGKLVARITDKGRLQNAR